MKSDAKFKEKQTRELKYEMWTLMSCHPTTQNPRNFALMSYFCLNVVRFELKKYGGAIFLDTEY